jgi:Ni,Fe-hydrogenase I cytochrome b subunit
VTIIAGHILTWDNIMKVFLKSLSRASESKLFMKKNWIKKSKTVTITTTAHSFIVKHNKSLKPEKMYKPIET